MLAILRNEMSAEERAEVERLLQGGMSLREVMDHLVKSSEEKSLAERIRQLVVEGRNLTSQEILDLMKEDMSSGARAEMQAMLDSGMSLQEVIDHFTKGQGGVRGETELAEKMRQLLAGGQDLTEAEMFELMKSQLGVRSRAQAEEMLKKGYTMQQVMEHLMRHGKTEEQEHKEHVRRMAERIEKGGMSKEQTLQLLRSSLDAEARLVMEDLLRQGYSMDEVVEMFKTHGNNLAAVEKDLSGKKVSFDEEPPDAHLYKDRDVFTVVDAQEVKARVPFMTPAGKKQSFRVFLDKVKEVAAGKGLTHREVLDIMAFRMGGKFKEELDQLRKEGRPLGQIVEYFLAKDEEMRQQARRRARLEAQAKVCHREKFLSI